MVQKDKIRSVVVRVPRDLFFCDYYLLKRRKKDEKRDTPNNR